VIKSNVLMKLYFIIFSIFIVMFKFNRIIICSSSYVRYCCSCAV
jgi:hypothetical protein